MTKKKVTRSDNAAKKKSIEFFEAEIKKLERREKFLKGAVCVKTVTEYLVVARRELEKLKSKKGSEKKENPDDKD